MSDHEKAKFKTDIGINATVKRGLVREDLSAIPNRKLIDLGLSFLDVAELQLKGYAYKGSAAVHIFTHETLNLLDFVSQTHPLQLYKCPEMLAARAFDDLVNTLKKQYGHKRPTLRSGF